MTLPAVLRVTQGGASAGWLELQSSFERAEFIAVDTEFTGWSDDPRIKSKDLEERYAGLRESVSSRAVVELGVSVFIADTASATTTDRLQLVVRNFEFLLCRDGNFQMSASSGMFLAYHGFDFSRMFLEGIRYKPASGASSDSRVCQKGGRAKPYQDSDITEWRALPHGLLWRIGASGAPLVVHNGLMDVLFLYSAFEGELPPTLQAFVAAFRGLVPSVYDTRNIAATVLEEKLSSLPFLYAKCVRRNKVNPSEAGLTGGSTKLWDRDHGRKLDLVDGLAQMDRGRFAPPGPRLAAQDTADDASSLCKSFVNRGFCANLGRCPHSHNIEAALDLQMAADAARAGTTQGLGHGNGDAAHAVDPEAKKTSADAHPNPRKKRRKLRREQRAAAAASQGPAPRRDHSAGFDAFCTGLVYRTMLEVAGAKAIETQRNHLFVAGRHEPLLMERSRFVEPTTNGSTETGTIG